MPVISINHVWKSFGKTTVLRGVDFQLQPGTITGLIGPSGGGKSVLLKIMAGVTPADVGDVDLGVCLRDEVGLMFQEGALFDSLSVFDNVAFSLVKGNVPTVILPKAIQDECHGKVEAILARVGLSNAMYKFPSQLSGGMRRRVSLARALVSRPKLLLLDDPTAGLDPVASSIIMNLIVEMHDEYKPTTLIISHDLRRLLPIVDSIVALFDGVARFHGTLAELRCDQCEALREFVMCRFDLSAGTSPEQAHT